jgi:hypothetical protein
MTYDPTIAAALMFSTDDLAANRAGWFSSGQQQMIQATAAAVRRGGPRRAIAIFVLFAFLTVMIAFGVAQSGGDAQQLAIALGALAAFGVLIGALLRQAQVRATRLLSAPLLMVEGVPKVSLHVSGGESAMTSYRVVVDGQRFSLDEERAAVLDDGRAYRVYFTQAMSAFMILSAEPV